MENKREIYEYMAKVASKDSISHHGIKGQKWGRRRFQDEDGSLTAAGKKRYGVGKGTLEKDEPKSNDPYDVYRTAYKNAVNAGIVPDRNGQIKDVNVSKKQQKQAREELQAARKYATETHGVKLTESDKFDNKFRDLPESSKGQTRPADKKRPVDHSGDDGEVSLMKKFNGKQEDPNGPKTEAQKKASAINDASKTKQDKMDEAAGRNPNQSKDMSKKNASKDDDTANKDTSKKDDSKKDTAKDTDASKSKDSAKKDEPKKDAPNDDATKGKNSDKKDDSKKDKGDDEKTDTSTKKNASDMTDKELAAAIKRKENEAKYEKLYTPEDAQKAKFEKQIDTMNKTNTVIDKSAKLTRDLKTASDESIRNAPKIRLNLDNMSDAELRSAINREQLERQYNDYFAPSTVTKGQQTVNSMLGAITTGLTVAGSALSVAIAIRQLLNK